ncbi:MAG: dihydrodipicolinate synthase family protein [Verrucomicrobiota bacterium]
MTAASYQTSVIAVPPLARSADGTVCAVQNTRLIRHMESGGVRILLYGGNANFYHIRPSEFASTLTMLANAAGPETEIVPSAGPSYGLMMDQAAILRTQPFRTAMVLPHVGLNTPDGVATGLRHFAEKFGRPIVVYMKNEGYITPALVEELVKDGLVSWIKYAIVRDDPAKDAVLSELADRVDPQLIVSGIGEQPALVHLDQFKLGGFTTGCGCVAPVLSQKVLQLARNGDWAGANAIRKQFEPLEDLRNEINPVRVLHEAVTLSGIADMGTILPLLSGLNPVDRSRVQAAAAALLALNTHPV